ncbi:uncharacterized protein LOC133915139 isoform X2 [Phragmites australis]|uniref:uncharacterized protein LOC133915139 isoform X2 n=1 Tax=Phragmites australis TaxID=29695 RepID=UPI002D76BFFE|nr:uncharacterized protein LOC133915139 isoform X2 [Phragmites australis]
MWTSNDVFIGYYQISDVALDPQHKKMILLLQLSWDVGEYKHKSSHRSSIRCLPDAQRNVTENSHLQPSVIAELNGCDWASGFLADSQKTSISWPRENKISTKNELCHASSTVPGLPIRPKYHLNNPNNNVKNPPTVKSCSNMNNFSYQLVKRGERSASTKMGSTSANCSLSEKMSLLRQPRNGGNHQNQNRISALNRRCKIVNSVGAINQLSIEKVHDQPGSSLGKHSQALFNNALVRQNQLCRSEQLNQKAPEQSWSSTYSESEKVGCFSSADSINDLHVSSSSDTSDNSNLSSLGVVANDQWMTFKKVYCPLVAHLESMSVIYRKEIGQASPISVLEPPSEDCSDSENVKREPADPNDLQLRLERVKFPPMETVAEASSIGGTGDLNLSSEMESNNDEPIQLVEDILEEFEDEEEREFSYLLDILIASGIHGTAEDQLFKVCQSLDCPAGYDVFENLEKKYIKIVQWPRSDRKLLFDMVNTILSQILAPCLNMQPWVNTARNLAPIWGSEGLLERVLQVLAQRREVLALSKMPEKKVFDQKWPDLSDCIDRAGRDIEKMIKDDLLEELLLELMSS